MPTATPWEPNQRWSIHFVADQLITGQKRKYLTVIDDLSKESPGILAARSITGAMLAEFFDCLTENRSLPKVIVCDNGSEFTSLKLDR